MLLHPAEAITDGTSSYPKNRKLQLMRLATQQAPAAEQSIDAVTKNYCENQNVPQHFTTNVCCCGMLSASAVLLSIATSNKA